MLCGFHVVLKFLLGRMLDVMRSQRGFEYWQLLVRLRRRKPLVAPACGGGPTKSMGISHRFRLRQTRRTVPITFSIELVQASERRSCAGKPRRLTSDSSSPSRMLPATPGASCSSLRVYCATTCGLVSIVEFPRLSQRLAHGGMQRFGQAIDYIAGFVNLAALDRRVPAKVERIIWSAPSRHRQ